MAFAGDSPFDERTTIIYLPKLEIAFIENNEIICNFYNDHVKKAWTKNGLTKMIYPNRDVILLETDPHSIERLLIEDQVRSFKVC